MKKLTDNEIIKALECCIVEVECENCPLYDNDAHAENCPTRLLRLLADLINRQKEGIYELQHKIVCCNAKFWTLKEKYEDFRCTYECELAYRKALHKRAKSEAWKEFAERLKEKSSAFGDVTACVVHTLVDNLVKEMEEKQNG